MENNSNKLSIPELARKMENQLLDPRTLDRRILQKCSIFFKSRGYSNEQISEILKVSIRTTERYLKNIREENSLKIGSNFQQELLGGVLNNLKLRYQRLLRLSYSWDLSDYEKARIVLMCQQVEMDGVALLTQLGYLSKEQGIEDVEFAEEEAEKVRIGLKESTRKKFDSLSAQQKNMALEYWKSMQEEAGEKIDKIMEKLLAENEKRKRGVLQLVCSVAVLCN